MPSARTTPTLALYTDEPEPWRRLACAMLLGGALGAHARDGDDIDWIAGDDARQLAELVGLPAWPPRWGQLGSRSDLVRRANGLAAVDDIGFRGVSSAVKRSGKGRLAAAAPDGGLMALFEQLFGDAGG